MTDTTTDSPKLLTDAPASTDLLGFKPHAERLAALIQKQIPDKASFVIGIEGEWGEGKSSFINLLKAAFPTEETDEARPTIVDFNPWWFEGSDQLLRHFFDELLEQIDRSGRWTAPARKFMRGLAGLLDGGGKAAQLVSDPGVIAAGKTAEKAGGLLKKLGAEKTRSAQVLKASSKHVLEAQRFKTVVFIDDLDRLPAREIVELFRVIKAVADLPNIVYVIAYDRAIVASALDEVHKGKGEAYLEKIIQYPYPLPRPHAKQKLAYNKKVIAQYLTDLPGGIDYHGVSRIVEAFLPVPRSVKRLSAALLDYRLGVQDGMEMDALDYLFLEAVRHFDMSVYDELLHAIFFSYDYCQLNLGHSLSGEKTPSARVAWVKERFEYTLENYANHPEVMDAIHFFTGFVFSESQEDAEQQGRSANSSKLLIYIASKEKNQAGRKLFRAYLARSRDEGEVSRQELEAFASIKYADALESYLQSIKQPRVESLLEDLSNGWNVIFQNTSSKDFILSWSYALQRNISVGKEFFYGVRIGDVLNIFSGIVRKDYRSLGWASGPVDAVEKWLEYGDLDDLVYRLVLNEHLILGLRGEDSQVIAKISGEFELSRMLTGGYFLNACKAIHNKSEKPIGEWLANIDAQDDLNNYQLWQLMDFIASDFVAEGHADALVKNKYFRQILTNDRTLLNQAKGDSDLQRGIDRLTGVA